jgi:hypothetical protein
MFSSFVFDILLVSFQSFRQSFIPVKPRSFFSWRIMFLFLSTDFHKFYELPVLNAEHDHVELDEEVTINRLHIIGNCTPTPNRSSLRKTCSVRAMRSRTTCSRYCTPPLVNAVSACAAVMLFFKGCCLAAKSDMR